MEPDSEEIDHESLDIKLVMNNDTELQISGFCDRQNSYRGENHFELTFVPKDFYQTPKIAEHSGLKSVINNLNPYDSSVSVDSDCNLDNTKLYQNNITDYKYLLKYLLSVKKNVLPAFRFEELYLAELSGIPLKEIDISSVQRNIPRQVARDKFWEMTPSSSSGSDNEILNIHYNNSITSIGSGFSKALENYTHNSQLISAFPGVISYDFPDFMDLRAGELVKLLGNATEDKNLTTGNYMVLSSSLKCTPGAVINTITFGAYDSN